MSKKLYEMTLEELWALFPIVLTEHDSRWQSWYEEEVETLKSFLPANIKFHHIGSTAIKDIKAKHIIDILIEVNSESQMERVSELLQQRDYLLMSSSENRISLNKGYTESGYAERVFHFHIRMSGDADEIYFRDYLNAHPDAAKEYEQLKLRLWKKYEHNRDAYTEAKTDFVKKYTDLAKREKSKC